MPLHPLLNCPQGRPNDPFCRFGWRIERLDGTLVQRVVGRVPRDNERLVERCQRCGKECKP